VGPVLTAIVIMTGLALLFATVLAVADHFLVVEEDPRLEAVSDLLPGTNCGACGEPGCAGFADALIEGRRQPGNCTVASEDTLVQIASVLDVDVGGGEKVVARLRCAGSDAVVRHLAEYRGMGSCRAAAVVDGGSKACPWGCLGLGDCERACDFDAIEMSSDGLPVVAVDPCTACGDCVEVCPLDLFVLQPVAHKLLVQCASPLEGDEARSRCTVACDACGRCALDAPERTVEMVGGLPVVHWDRELEPSAAATFRCPTGAIVWVEGEQFETPEVEERFGWRRHA